MRVILFLSVIVLNIVNAEAAELSRQIWSQRDAHYLFTFLQSSNLLISENCLNNTVSLAQSKCDAAKALKKTKSLTIAPTAFAGGKNPGAVACSEGLKKIVRVLKDSQNNENAFCVFEDGSMISASNLESLLKE